MKTKKTIEVTKCDVCNCKCSDHTYEYGGPVSCTVCEQDYCYGCASEDLENYKAYKGYNGGDAFYVCKTCCSLQPALSSVLNGLKDKSLEYKKLVDDWCQVKKETEFTLHNIAEKVILSTK